MSPNITALSTLNNCFPKLACWTIRVAAVVLAINSHAAWAQLGNTTSPSSRASQISLAASSPPGRHSAPAPVVQLPAPPSSAVPMAGMDHLTFITKLLEHGAWPLAACAIILFMRAEIRSLLPYMKKFKAGPVEADFEHAVSEMSTKAASLPTPSVAPELLDPDDDIVIQLAKFHPRSAILESWREVEIAANQALSKRLPNGPAAPMRATQVVNHVLDAKLLSAEAANTLQSLRTLRNQVIHEHGFEPSLAAAKRYVQSAKQLKVLLEGFIVAG